MSGLWKRDFVREKASLAAGLSGACTPHGPGDGPEGLHIIPVLTTRINPGSSWPCPGHRDPTEHTHSTRNTRPLPLLSPNSGKGQKTFPALSCWVPGTRQQGRDHGLAGLPWASPTPHFTFRSLTAPQNVKHLHCYQRILLQIPAELITDFEKSNLRKQMLVPPWRTMISCLPCVKGWTNVPRGLRKPSRQTKKPTNLQQSSYRTRFRHWAGKAEVLLSPSPVEQKSDLSLEHKSGTFAWCKEHFLFGEVYL